MSCKCVFAVCSLQCEVHAVAVFHKVIIDIFNECFHGIFTCDTNLIRCDCSSGWNCYCHTMRCCCLFACSKFCTQYKWTIFETISILAIRKIFSGYFHWKFHGDCCTICDFCIWNNDVATACCIVVFCVTDCYRWFAIHNPIRNTETKLYVNIRTADFQCHGVLFAQVAGLLNGITFLCQCGCQVLIDYYKIILFEIDTILQFCEVLITGTCTTPEV